MENKGKVIPVTNEAKIGSSRSQYTKERTIEAANDIAQNPQFSKPLIEGPKLRIGWDEESSFKISENSEKQ